MIEILAGVTTLAILGTLWIVVRTMEKFGRAADILAETGKRAQESLWDVSNVARELHEVAARLTEVLPYVQRTASRFETVATRAAGLSEVVLQEVEAPLRTSIVLLHGLKFGASALFSGISSRLLRRFRSTPHASEGFNHA
jgi:hypothetical protein